MCVCVQRHRIRHQRRIVYMAVWSLGRVWNVSGRVLFGRVVPPAHESRITTTQMGHTAHSAVEFGNFDMVKSY